MSTTAAQRPSARVTPLTAAPKASATAREFPVRFNSTPGPLGWINAGSVLLDEQGIRVNPRRLTLLGLRRTSRLIEVAAIREVYREGAAIQIDLQVRGRRSTCRFYAADAHQAAEIVRLLPTNRTIELDNALPPRSAGSPDRDFQWSSLGIPLGAVLLVVLAWLGATHLPFVSGVSAPERLKSPHSELPLQSAQVVKRAAVAPSQAETLQARQDLEKFIPRFDALTLQFAVAFEALQLGKLSQPEFADGLQRSLLPQWDALAAELESAADSQGNSVRTDADVALKGATDSWRQALPTYAHGLRNNDSREVLKAFGYIADAEGYERESRDLLDRLNTP